MFETNLAELYETKYPSRYVLEQTPKKEIFLRKKSKTAKKIIFLDRDGPCLIEPKTDGQIDSLARLEFTPGVIVYLREILRRQDFLLVMVSNQNGVGSKSFPKESFLRPHRFMLETFASQEIIFDKIFVDLSFPEEKQATRKPGTGMLKEYLSIKDKTEDKTEDKDFYDLKNSIVIGDRETDMLLAKNLGCKGIWFQEETQEPSTEEILPIVFVSNRWSEISQFLDSVT